MKPVMCLTGGAHGLGREIVARFFRDYQIIILDLDQKVMSQVAHTFNCDYQTCDVSDYESVDKSIKYIIKNYHQIDCLINSAGIYIDGNIDLNDPKLIKKVVEVNVVGQMNLCKYVVPFMKKSKSGTIINVNSTAGLHPKAGNSVYHASKWATEGFTESLQLELSKSGIKVTSLCPGVMNTKFTHGSNMKCCIEVEEVVKAIDFILSFGNKITIPQLIIKHL
jgi:3-oxoacyl-[acyl-carrier protein] reductase